MNLTATFCASKGLDTLKSHGCLKLFNSIFTFLFNNVRCLKIEIILTVEALFYPFDKKVITYCLVQILEGVVQPIWPWDASSSVCRGLPAGHTRGNWTVRGAARLSQTSKSFIIVNIFIILIAFMLKIVLSYNINRRFLNWRRSTCGIVPQKQPRLIKAPQLGFLVMISAWQTPLKTTCQASWPSAPVI